MRFSERIFRRIKLLPSTLWLKVRTTVFWLLSDCRSVMGRPRLIQAAMFSGKGSIRFGDKVTLGVRESPGLYTSYSYIEARNSSSEICIADDVWINNNLCLIADSHGIHIGTGCRIGPNLTCFDSNFHEIPLGSSAPIKGGAVNIGEHVFVGANVTITHSVTIGEHAVIGAGAVVTRDVPPYSIVSGNPAVVVKRLQS